MANINYADISNEISALRKEIKLYQEKINKINEAIGNLNSCMDTQGTSDTNIFSQGENTFKWLKDNLDFYWTDMVGENRKDCVRNFEYLVDSNSSPIAVVKAECSNVLSAAQTQIEKYEEKITECSNRISELEVMLANIES